MPGRMVGINRTETRRLNGPLMQRYKRRRESETETAARLTACHGKSPVAGCRQLATLSFEGEGRQQRLDIQLMPLKKQQSRMEHRIFKDELRGAQQIQRMNIGDRHARLHVMVTLNERTDNEAPEFLLSKRQVRIVDGIFCFNFSKHVDKRFGAHFHESSPGRRSKSAWPTNVILRLQTTHSI
ncbi:hypothetical protein PCAR4_200100 [Paraburkholderia caribensis]|nr:hypothetical protein PCAR4_200100 [Paraburkholderia caribensis]